MTDEKFPRLPVQARVSSEGHVVSLSRYHRRRRVLSFIARVRLLRRLRWLFGRPDVFDQTCAFMAQLGVTAEAADDAAERACNTIGAPYSRLYTSAHYKMIAAIALSGFKPATILEIGTGAGQATRFLAEVFPDAKVHTVELPHDDPIYGPNTKGFDLARRANFLDLPQITAHEKNSAFLSELNLPDFDLIWLDGGHVFPEVAWDHYYCMSKIRKGGWILTDDVRLPNNPLYRVYEGSTDAYQALRYYAERTAHRFFLIIKRTDAHRNMFDPKYVGAIHVV